MDVKVDFNENEINKDDLAFEDGDLVVIDGYNCIKQQAKIGLFIMPADWFLDITKGVNWFLGFRNNEKTLQAQVKDALKAVENVVRLSKFKFDVSDRQHWKITAILYSTNNEEIDLSVSGLTVGGLNE